MELPTPADIISARNKAGLTQTQAAELVGATLRGWQGWESQPGSAASRQMPAGLWALFLLKTDQAPGARLLSTQNGWGRVLAREPRPAVQLPDGSRDEQIELLLDQVASLRDQVELLDETLASERQAAQQRLEAAQAHADAWQKQAAAVRELEIQLTAEKKALRERQS